MEIDGYSLSRQWWDWSFENPEKVNTNHAAIYWFAIEHCNRLGWKEKFGFPTQMVMDAIGIKKHQTYIKYFNDLVEWGFIKVIEKAKNQYSANIISLKSARPKSGNALDKANINHAAKQTQKQLASIGQSNSSIDKPLTNKQINHKQINNTEGGEKNEEIKKVEIQYPFSSEEFINKWKDWKEYKKSEHKFRYKSPVTETDTLKDLSDLAGGDEKTAIAIIQQAIAKNWKGFYPLKNNNDASRDIQSGKIFIPKKPGEFGKL